ncbi:hypothetical protein [Streptomyces sp. NPDC002564]|uniref:hypothetical protein n=1 Tax=Streptomyces sp. NPDC002564 TaxID=3364649 RepID=UPI0036B1B765
MARVRFIGPDPVTVPELGGRAVEPDQVVEVPDDRYEGYVCQPQTWEAVEEPRDEPGPDEPMPAPDGAAPAREISPLRKSAAKPQKEG